MQCSDLTMQGHGCTFGAQRCRTVDDLLNVLRDTAQVAALYIGKQVQSWRDVVVGHYIRAGRARERRNGTQDDCATTASRNRQGGQLRQATHTILRRGTDHRIGHPVRRIEPERRCSLRGARQRSAQAGSDIALRDAQLRGPFTVNVHLQRRVAFRLLQTQVCNARDVLQAPLQLCGIVPVGSIVGARNFHIQRCRRSEVENLTACVSWQEGKSSAREARWQRLAQTLNVVRRWLMLWLE
ncbi:hypothetical protein D3C76_1115560 [compost metagenome]